MATEPFGEPSSLERNLEFALQEFLEPSIMILLEPITLWDLIPQSIPLWMQLTKFEIRPTPIIVCFLWVMGRHSGHIALSVGLASGAESILLPETVTDVNALVASLRSGGTKNKSSNIVVVSEGDEAGGAFKMAEEVRKLAPEYDTKVTVLGHIQRGGAPSAFDRILGTRLGVAAVEGLMSGKSDVMAGLINNQVAYTPYATCVSADHTPDAEMIRLAYLTSI